MQEQKQTKKMNLIQMTFIVAVNMMGSEVRDHRATDELGGGRRDLPAVLDRDGGRLNAIAYGLAQAGIFNQRPAGMWAYAEDASGKWGHFMVFFLYFLSLAIGNAVIAISALGYLPWFFPWLSSTPISAVRGYDEWGIAHRSTA